MKFAYAAAVAVFLLASSAQAQNVLMMNGGGNFPAYARPGMPGINHSQTITINFQFTVPAKPLTDDADVTKTMADTSQSLYDIIDHECLVLAASLKGNCHLVQMNVGGNINAHAVPNATVSANAMATFEITPAEMAAPPTPAK